jgi:hypothetical protein
VRIKRKYVVFREAACCFSALVDSINAAFRVLMSKAVRPPGSQEMAADVSLLNVSEVSSSGHSTTLLPHESIESDLAFAAGSPKACMSMGFVVYVRSHDALLSFSALPEKCIPCYATIL